MGSAAWLPFVNTYNTQTQGLHRSMKRLATGKRFVTPGDAPADAGVAERLEMQIRNSKSAADVMQNGINMLQSVDAWQESALSMITRMSELAIAAGDSSKSDVDRQALDLEFQQLRQQIAYISESAKFNGLLINSKTAVAVYDTIDKKLVISQGDGSDVRTIELVLRDGNTSQNNVPYCFENSSGVPGDYILGNNGKDLFYVAQKSGADGITAFKTIMKLNLESNMITKKDLPLPGSTASLQTTFVMDDKNQVWVSKPVSGGGFRIARLDTASMTLDEGTLSSTPNPSWTAANASSSGDIRLAAKFPRFAVHEGYAYFVKSGTGGMRSLIKQSLNSSDDRKVLIKDLSTTCKVHEGHKYTISPDGTYFAWVSSTSSTPADAVDGILTILNAETNKTVSQPFGTNRSSVAAMSFDRNNRFYYTDTGSNLNRNAVRRIDIGVGKDGITPVFLKDTTIRSGIAGRFGLPDATNAAKYNYGISVAGDSPAVEYGFQIGPDPGMSIKVTSADMRAANLGLTKLNVRTAETAQIAQTAIIAAQEKISRARAEIGAQVSRLQFTMSANENYISNIATTKASIVDTDMAEETAKMTQAQLKQMASTSMLTNFNQQQQSLMQSLLRGI